MHGWSVDGWSVDSRHWELGISPFPLFKFLLTTLPLIDFNIPAQSRFAPVFENLAIAQRLQQKALS